MKYMHALLSLGAIALSSPAMTQDTMYVAGYSGDFQTMFEKEIAPGFEAKNNVKIVYVAGNSSETIAKLQAQKGNQEINVALVDDGPMHQAVQFGLCDALAEAPVYNDIYDVAKVSVFGGKAVGVGLVATGITYNKKLFDENGWPAPTSWNDLTDEKFAQRVTSNPISGTFGLNTLVMFARMNGGGEKNIEPGFDAIRDKLAPNVLSWSSSNAQLAQMFQNGDIDLGVWGSNRAVALKKTGFPVEFVYPSEGAPAIVASACSVAGNRLPEKSQALLQYLASPEVQAKFASQGFGPTNSKAKLEGALAEEVPYGAEKLSKLVNVDWDTINQNRAEWTKQWTRTVE
ncbi:branched-chain amino acid ABC transporter substrate-binding protein [Sinorhizobium medicae]|uniref:Branched-chain amino acid ABC transporter substrate-binding protein n=2 Tax=Sinorhizobium medicae TaxID=110321 RepID=A0ABX4TJY9_9HYPH|nr:branched-chain amino acid ABC transporter substrate-binding protein [Sinorhizobium medicae]PLU02565.1 branched-chain amino acid ABC transporter substrate-binding protein [Sinorhizobium medicae]PLU13259.1 branched-chain amino acid ABC transporter substrate-binding protein [Sinorhizobium medicae]PLU19155.1 branched-chain amino acid ABC transporter substrate-binding protein [Sinorhizobium medicae]PLU33597.1 branched-chain amino acid ABC transporter substrate-binding protein [Sinorhizobium medic